MPAVTDGQHVDPPTLVPSLHASAQLVSSESHPQRTHPHAQHVLQPHSSSASPAVRHPPTLNPRPLRSIAPTNSSAPLQQPRRSDSYSDPYLSYISSSPASASQKQRTPSVIARGESISLARRAAATAKKRREEARAELERRGVRDGVETALEQLVGANASTRANVSQNKAKRLKRVKWTDQEVSALRQGVTRYGEGRWAVILREYATSFNPVRISVDLKDKWRNLSKTHKPYGSDTSPIPRRLMHSVGRDQLSQPTPVASLPSKAADDDITRGAAQMARGAAEMARVAQIGRHPRVTAPRQSPEVTEIKRTFAPALDVDVRQLTPQGAVSSVQAQVAPGEQSTVAATPQTADSNLATATAIAPPLVTPVENPELTSIAHEIVSKHDAGDLEAHRIENAMQDAANAVHAQEVHGEIQVEHVTIQEQELSSDAPVPSQVLSAEQAVQLQSEHANQQQEGGQHMYVQQQTRILEQEVANGQRQSAQVHHVEQQGRHLGNEQHMPIDPASQQQTQVAEQQVRIGQTSDLTHDQEVHVHQSHENIHIDTQQTERGSVNVDHMHVERVHEQIEAPASSAQQTGLVQASDTVIHNVEVVEQPNTQHQPLSESHGEGVLLQEISHRVSEPASNADIEEHLVYPQARNEQSQMGAHEIVQETVQQVAYQDVEHEVQQQAQYQEATAQESHMQAGEHVTIAEHEMERGNMPDEDETIEISYIPEPQTESQMEREDVIQPESTYERNECTSRDEHSAMGDVVDIAASQSQLVRIHEQVQDRGNLGSNGEGVNATDGVMVVDAIEAEASEGEVRRQPHVESAVVGDSTEQDNRVRLEMHAENDPMSVTQQVEAKFEVESAECNDLRAEEHALSASTEEEPVCSESARAMNALEQAGSVGEAGVVRVGQTFDIVGERGEFDMAGVAQSDEQRAERDPFEKGVIVENDIGYADTGGVECEDNGEARNCAKRARSSTGRLSGEDEFDENGSVDNRPFEGGEMKDMLSEAEDGQKRFEDESKRRKLVIDAG